MQRVTTVGDRPRIRYELCLRHTYCAFPRALAARATIKDGKPAPEEFLNLPLKHFFFFDNEVSALRIVLGLQLFSLTRWKLALFPNRKEEGIFVAC